MPTISICLIRIFFFFTDVSDSRWGASLGEDRLSGLWSQEVLKFSINHCELLAVLLAIWGFLHLLRDQSVSLFTNNTTTLAYRCKEGGHAVCQPQCCGSGYSSPLRGERSSSAPPVCSVAAQLPDRLPQSRFPSPGIRMDPLPGGLSRAFPLLVGHHRPVRRLPEPLSSGAFFTNGGSTVGRDRRYAPIVGQPPGLRVPSIRLHSACTRQGSLVSEPRVDLSGAVLAPEAVVPGSLGALSGCTSPSVYAERSTQTTTLPSFPSEPPPTSNDWLSYCE